jgi:hypothetical protein
MSSAQEALPHSLLGNYFEGSEQLSDQHSADLHCQLDQAADQNTTGDNDALNKTM